MIRLEHGGLTFNYRVVAAAFDAGRVLLHRAERDDFWALPGGRAQIGEPAPEALRRELREELDEEVRVERLLWVVDNFFDWQGRAWHELALIFEVRLPAESELLRRDEPFRGYEDGVPLIFQWFAVEGLAPVRLYPTFLREALAHPPDRPVYLVHRDPSE